MASFERMAPDPTLAMDNTSFERNIPGPHVYKKHIEALKEEIFPYTYDTKNPPKGFRPDFSDKIQFNFNGSSATMSAHTVLPPDATGFMAITYTSDGKILKTQQAVRSKESWNRGSFNGEKVFVDNTTGKRVLIYDGTESKGNGQYTVITDITYTYPQQGYMTTSSESTATHIPSYTPKKKQTPEGGFVGPEIPAYAVPFMTPKQPTSVLLKEAPSDILVGPEVPEHVLSPDFPIEEYKPVNYEVPIETLKIIEQIHDFTKKDQLVFDEPKHRQRLVLLDPELLTGLLSVLKYNNSRSKPYQIRLSGTIRTEEQNKKLIGRISDASSTSPHMQGRSIDLVVHKKPGDRQGSKWKTNRLDNKLTKGNILDGDVFRLTAHKGTGYHLDVSIGPNSNAEIWTADKLYEAGFDVYQTDLGYNDPESKPYTVNSDPPKWSGKKK